MMKITKISVVRIVGMFLIFATHLFLGFYGSSLGYFFNVGVPLFFIISGYLYGKKEIKEPLNWYFRRFVKICIPMYIFVLLVWLYCFIRYEAKFPYSYILNLQGLSFIFIKMKVGYFVLPESMGGIGHFWFLTVIMLCYLLLILMKKLESTSFMKNVEKNPKVEVVLCILIVAVQIALAYVGFQIVYFIEFFLGYAMNKKDLSFKGKKSFLLISLIMVVALGTRLVVRKFADGTVLHDNIVVSWSQCVLALWIYAFFDFLLSNLPRLESTLGKSKLISWLDGISYFAYITHYIFIKEPFNLQKYIPNMIVATLVFLVLSFASAEILKLVSKPLTDCLNKLAGKLSKRKLKS